MYTSSIVRSRYEPDSESVVVRKLKDQVERLLMHEERSSSVRRELEQRAKELTKEMADLEQGWNSALKTLELERAEHEEHLDELRAQIDQSTSIPSVVSQHLHTRLETAGGHTTSKIENTASAALETELLRLNHELEEAQAQAALARRQRVDAEVKAIALRKSLQRNNEILQSASPPRDSAGVAPHSRATRAQYDLFEMFAGVSAERAGDEWATTDERIRAERLHLTEGHRETERHTERHTDSHWSQSWFATPAQRRQGVAATRQNMLPPAVVNAGSWQRPERLPAAWPERLAAGVPQRALSGTYAGRTWAQSWHDGETPKDSYSRPGTSALGNCTGIDSSEKGGVTATDTTTAMPINGWPARIGPERRQLTERYKATQRHTRRHPERHRDVAGPAATTTSRPRSADIMLRWAIQEQVECLVPTASPVPFNSKALKWM